MMRVPSAHREHKNSSELVMSKREGLDVGKYENTPHSDNGIQSPVSENNIEWSSIVRIRCLDLPGVHYHDYRLSQNERGNHVVIYGWNVHSISN